MIKRRKKCVVETGFFGFRQNFLIKVVVLLKTLEFALKYLVYRVEPGLKKSPGKI